MKSFIAICILTFMCGNSQAQWWLAPGGNWWESSPTVDSIFIFAPIGSDTVFGYFIATSTQIIPLATDVIQDSIRGRNFRPEHQSNGVQFSLNGTSCNYFYYFPLYEDTSVIRVSASDGTTTGFIYVTAITIVRASNEYSLSRSTFDTLPPGDTELATLTLFNQTPDSEWLYASFSVGTDFYFLDSVNFPDLIPPGDSLPPIRLVYRADVLRPFSSDSLNISVQRIRGDSDYKSPILFRNLLTGGCKVAVVSGVTSASPESSPMIYPNPSLGEIQILGMNQADSFEIYDILGNRIFRSQYDQHTWNGSNDAGNLCKSGEYFVKVESNGHPQFLPFIISR